MACCILRGFIKYFITLPQQHFNIYSISSSSMLSHRHKLSCLSYQTEFPLCFSLIVVSENIPFWQSSVFFLLFCSLLLCFSFPEGDPMSVGIIVSCTIDYMSCSENRNYSPLDLPLLLLLNSRALSFYSPVVTLLCCLSGSFCCSVVYYLFLRSHEVLPWYFQCCHNAF